MGDASLHLPHQRIKHVASSTVPGVELQGVARAPYRHLLWHGNRDTHRQGRQVNFTRTLAGEWGPYGITVNALAPGFVITPLTADLTQGAGSRAERAAARTLLKRVAYTDDLIGPLLFLASNMSRYVTGLILPVDGGYSAN